MNRTGAIRMEHELNLDKIGERSQQNKQLVRTAFPVGVSSHGSGSGNSWRFGMFGGGNMDGPCNFDRDHIRQSVTLASLENKFYASSSRRAEKYGSGTDVNLSANVGASMDMNNGMSDGMSDGMNAGMTIYMNAGTKGMNNMNGLHGMGTGTGEVGMKANAMGMKTVHVQGSMGWPRDQWYASTIHGGPKPYLCKICNGRFKKKEHVERHMLLIHEKQRPYNCGVCDMVFSTLQNYESHTTTQRHQQRATVSN
eukprot:Plantae.Rhodophyta-Hildenbrandia_rubra.ctg9161.p1 GENE.Plantae.Rhodophyta-Hildenbrandia_rubra.ctg9161~~Plantae.Rhodophyta-Hildenbrandia_rubra.ctg9161.p1  ORF type:complete len:253 (+),score=38.21 Plantae.Rhodophyta-Hildenbrandia_rubra.ctg9161:343-1101(+)